MLLMMLSEQFPVYDKETDWDSRASASSFLAKLLQSDFIIAYVQEKYIHANQDDGSAEKRGFWHRGGTYCIDCKQKSTGKKVRGNDEEIGQVLV